MYKYKSLQTGFLKNLLNFIIIKYLKQVDNNLSFCVAERSHCGLSATGDIKTYECHKRSKVNEVTKPNNESALWDSFNDLFLLPKKLASLQLEIKRFFT